MNIKEALAIFKTKAEISRVLNIRTSAVSNWGESIPKLRQYELKEYIEKHLK